MNKRIYFKGLSELRGIAALAVIFHHIELYKQRENIANLFQTRASSFIEHLGKNGVYLFFVLSGFLITYLLLAEMKETGNIDVKKFYIRRILRIWPLYYLIVAISFFLFPFIVNRFELSQGSFYALLTADIHTHFFFRIVLFLLFLPNLALIISGPVAGVSQTWSVGVEEQFYFIWPRLIKAGHKNMLVLLISVIALKFMLLFGLQAIMISSNSKIVENAIDFLGSFNIELMALGGLGAYLLINGYLKNIYNQLPKYSSILILILMAFLIWNGANYFLLSIVFLLFILFNINDRLALFRSKFFSFYGDISYGVYMYHPLVMFFSFTFINKFIPVKNILQYNLVIYILVFGVTTLISHLSFKYFEAYFLRLKHRFEIIPSGK